ncbi:MAG TPA: hypothetical protein VN231_06090 [Allosphingosinicella sp.]|nr:hypothetical protein [Allosphingosinicella sp.]
MTRSLDAALATEISKPHLNPFLAVHLALPDPVWAWTGRGTLLFADEAGVEQRWTGTGGIGSVDPIGEATDGSAVGYKITLFNVPGEFRDDIAEQVTRGARGEIYVGSLDQAYQQVVAAQMLARGRVDDYRISDSGGSIAVEVMIENRSIDQRRPAIRRFTDEWQQRRFPGDKFFEFAAQMNGVKVMWGQAEQAAPRGGGGGGSGARGGIGFVRPF